MAALLPRMISVHDGHGRLAIYIDESVGRDAIVSNFGPRYQLIIVHGEPCTIFFDKNIRYYCIGPVFYKQDLMDRPDRYEHITDLDWLPPAGPAGDTGGSDGNAGHAGRAGPAGNTGGPAGNTGGPAGHAGPSGRADGPTDNTRPAGPAAPDDSTKKIPHPPTSWTVFMQSKWHELREKNPNVSFGEVSTEAARQWKAMSDEDKGFYQEMAKQAAEQHNIQYPDYRNKSARK